MRKQPTKPANSEEGLSAVELSKQLREISQRVARLEAEVFGGFAPPLAMEPQQPVKGRRARLDPAACVERRNRLVGWLEQNWPFLSVRLRQAKNLHDAINAVKAARERIQGVFQPPFYRDAEKFEVPLWQFLQSGRFRGNPRNLAGAMAGLPELSWKRSFDICAKDPFKFPPLEEAIWDHMRRNFPDRLRELGSCTTPEDVAHVLARSPTTDPTYNHLKEHPDRALDWLNAGRPIAEDRSETPMKSGRRPPKRRL